MRFISSLQSATVPTSPRDLEIVTVLSHGIQGSRGAGVLRCEPKFVDCAGHSLLSIMSTGEKLKQRRLRLLCSQLEQWIVALEEELGIAKATEEETRGEQAAGIAEAYFVNIAFPMIAVY